MIDQKLFSEFFNRLVSLVRAWRWRDWVGVGCAVLGSLSLGFGFWQVVSTNVTTSPILASASQLDLTGVEQGQLANLLDQPTETVVWVDVSGAVVNPGLYVLPHGSRVGEALKMAGGFAEDADPLFVSQALNLATPLSDGNKLYIPTKNEQTLWQEWQDVLGQGVVPEVLRSTALAGGADAMGGLEWGSGLEVKAGQVGLSGSLDQVGQIGHDSNQVGLGSGQADQGGVPANLVSINHATATQLESLAGIGPARSASIIEGRPYERLEELYERKIISANLFEQLRAELTL